VGQRAPRGNGIFTLTTVESSAKSNYNGITIGLKRVLDPNFQFQVNYTLSYDKSDDDNERDPFTFRYAQAIRCRRSTTGATAISVTGSTVGCRAHRAAACSSTAA